MSYSKVFVLTLNWNGKYLLDDCLSSYLYNDYPNFKVVMIDNGSTDGSVEYVRQKYPKVIILQNGKNLGYSGGFNKGLEYAFRFSRFLWNCQYLSSRKTSETNFSRSGGLHADNCRD